MALTLAALHIYPVKGLKGIELSSAACTDRGLEHDRRWMVVDADGEFLSQREHPKMATVWTEIADGALRLSAPDMAEVDVPLEPRSSAPVRVRVWSSVCDAIHASSYADAWLSEYLGLRCRLVYMPESTRRLSNPEHAKGERLVSFADGYAYLVTTEASLAEVNRRIAANGGKALPMNRFRPNLVIRGGDPFDEDHWRELRVGDAVLRAAKPCGRCQVTTTDQSTGEVAGPEPLATLSTFREDKRFGLIFGVNYVTEKTGAIGVGDAVEAG